MEFITDFISNQATLLIGLVVVLAFIIKLLIARLSKDTSTAIATNEIVDTVADKVIEEIKDIKAEREKRGLVPPLDIKIPMPAVKPPRLDNPNAKEGFQVIHIPINMEFEVELDEADKPKRKVGRPKKVKSNESETI
jgi:hypothetical protein